MNSYDIALSFIGNSPLRITLASKRDKFSNSNKLENLSKYNFTESPKLDPNKLMSINSGALNISLGASGQFSLANNQLYIIAKDILQYIEMPPAQGSDADKVSAYNALIRSHGIYDTLLPVQSAFSNKNVACSDIKINGQSIFLTDKLWYYPAQKMNIECQSLNANNRFVSDFNEFFKLANTVSDIPSSTVFIKNRSHLVSDLFESAVLYESQLQADVIYHNKETRRCFNTSNPYINTILNAGALKVSIKNGGADLVLAQPVDPIHHEAYFAITPTQQQDYATHNEKIIFSSRSPVSDSNMKDDILDLSGALPAISGQTIVDAIGIKLNIRSIAGSTSGSCQGPVVCFNSFGNKNGYQW